MAPAFSNLTALAEGFERAELDILRRALDRLEEIDGEPAFHAEHQVLVGVVEQSIGALFVRDNMRSGATGHGTHGESSMLGRSSCSTMENAALQRYISGSSIGPAKCAE